jgi:hypothetical protein
MALRNADVPQPRFSRGSPQWRYLASEIMAERVHYPRRARELIAAAVADRLGFPIRLDQVKEVELIFGRPKTHGHVPDSTRHELRPARLKHTHNPLEEEET